jgi:hypothetical protein
MVRNLVAAVLVLALGGVAIMLQDPPDTSTPKRVRGSTTSREFRISGKR